MKIIDVNEKTYVICHMLQSIDGKISGKFFQEPVIRSLSQLYGKMSQEYNADALVYGSVTANEIFIHDQSVDLRAFSNQQIERKDFISFNGKSKWLVVIDPMGSLAWNNQSLSHKRLKDKNVIEVLSEKVSDEYLANLRTLGVSYIFAGKEYLSMKTVLEKLGNEFHIEKVLLQGGGIVNESFANEGLIDEISLIIAPIIDGESNVPTSFESGTLKHPAIRLSNYHLIKTQILHHSGLWLNYVKNTNIL